MALMVPVGRKPVDLIQESHWPGGMYSDGAEAVAAAPAQLTQIPFEADDGTQSLMNAVGAGENVSAPLVVPTVVEGWYGVPEAPAMLTGCVEGKFETLTEPMAFGPAGRAGSAVTPTVPMGFEPDGSETPEP